MVQLCIIVHILAVKMSRKLRVGPTWVQTNFEYHMYILIHKTIMRRLKTSTWVLWVSWHCRLFPRFVMFLLVSYSKMSVCYTFLIFPLDLFVPCLTIFAHLLFLLVYVRLFVLQTWSNFVSGMMWCFGLKRQWALQVIWCRRATCSMSLCVLFDSRSVMVHACCNL